MNSTRISQAWLKVTEIFSVSPILFGVMVMTPDWESVDCEFEQELLFLERKT